MSEHENRHSSQSEAPARWAIIEAVRVMWPVVDAACILLAWIVLAALLNYLTGPSHGLWLFWVGLGVRLGMLQALGQYRSLLRYSGLHDLLGVTVAVLTGTAVLLVAWLALGKPSLVFVVFEGLLTLMLCAGNRLAVRLGWEWRSSRSGQRVLVYGAGGLGELAVRTLRRSSTFNPVGFIDDTLAMRGAVIHGRKVLGTFADLPQIIAKYRPTMLIIAVRTFPQSRLREVFAVCMGLGVSVKQIGGIAEALDGKGDLSVEDLAIEDLLRRPPRNLDSSVLPGMLAGKVVMVTGAGGSIGSEICRQVADHGPARLVLVDHSEAALYRIDTEIRDRLPKLAIEPVLLDLTCGALLSNVLTRIRPDVILHAAAYKHVPMVEANPIAGVRNNVSGFRNLLDSAVAAGVGRLVLISTDKAVRPTNVMGATKRVCELLMQTHPAGSTRMCAVRFGNVLGSSGSVVPRFLQQIAAGGPVTVTDPRMTRYFMLIPEAVDLVLRAGAMADHGEIFILDMGQPAKIDDMARQLIHLTGHVPDRDIAIVYTGLRPGEKLYEELLIDQSEQRTAVDGITVAHGCASTWTSVHASVTELLMACESGDLPGLVQTVKELVPEWEPSLDFREMTGKAVKTA